MKIFSICWLVLWGLAALLAPHWLYERAMQMDAAQALLPPSSAHWFGTDALGRDLLMRLLAGSSVSLGVSVSAVALSVFLGVWLGAIAGYFGGFREKLVLGLLNLFLCFPVFFLILAVMAVAGAGIWNIIWILGLTGWMGVARLVRAEVLSLRDREFILASRALGASHKWVLRKHLIPNAFGPVRVAAVFGISNAILTEAGLSFLGIGIQPPIPSWGNLLMDGKAVLGYGWWMMFFPGLAIFLTVYSLNVLGGVFSHARRTAS